MSDHYAYWREELSGQQNDRDTNRRDICGRWRIIGAKTKPDYPVAIWPDETGELLVKIGHSEHFSSLDEGPFYDFLGFSWIKCQAVTEFDYQMAIETGIWPDGKPSVASKKAKIINLEKLAMALASNSRVKAAIEAVAQEMASVGKTAPGMEIVNERIK